LLRAPTLTVGAAIAGIPAAPAAKRERGKREKRIERRKSEKICIFCMALDRLFNGNLKQEVTGP